MKHSDGHTLRIELDTKHCNLSATEIAQMERDLGTLSRCAKDFPVSDLYVAVIHHPRTQDFHVKTALVLSGRTLFTGDHDVLMHPAYERCIGKLVRKVQAYKSRMSGDAEVSHAEEGTAFRIEPTSVPDGEAIARAVSEDDYEVFRRACDVYEEPVRKSVGRWIQRYPKLNAEIGENLPIADIVEEVFLNAFEQFDSKPQNVPMSDWLDSLIDPSLTALTQRPDDELDNVSFVRSWLEAPARAQ
jgi:ribosome-associated translation inhibitor RaiA